MISTIIIAATVIISVIAFKNEDIMNKYKFNPVRILRHKEYHRLFTYGFLHANWDHLIVNSLVLFFFGSVLEQYFAIYFKDLGLIYFILLYAGGLIISVLFDLYKNKNNYYYNAIGASGATSAVVFACIFFDPWQKLYLMFFIPIPGIIFAILYIAYSYYMSKKNNDNIGHNSHLFGALFGFIFPIIIKPNLFSLFLQNITNF